MNAHSRKTTAVITTAVVLAVGRVGLPALLTWLANIAVRKLPALRGQVRRVQLGFVTPGLLVEGLSLATQTGAAPAYCVKIGVIAVKSDWETILAGKLMASLYVDAPRLLLDVNSIRGNRGDRVLEQQCKKADRYWQEKIMGLPRFKIASAVLTDGEVCLIGLPGEKSVEVVVDCLNLRAENITNSIDLAPTLMATLSANARVLTSGNFQLQAQGYPLAKPPTFNADLSSSDIDLSVLRNIIEKAVEIDVRRGILDLYVEAASSDGYIRGYAKPVFDHLELEPPASSGFTARVKTWAVEALTWFVKNKRKDRIATRLDFEGPLDAPDLAITDALLKFIRNAFSTAQKASLEHRIWFSHAGRTPDEVIIHDQSEPRGRTSAFFALAKETFSRWRDDSAPRMAAALSYYTAFSMAPLLILAISIAGLVLGHDAAKGKIMTEIGGLVGPKSATAIEDMLQGASRSSKGLVASIVGILSLVVAATGVLSELKSALNTIWRTQEPGDVKEMIKKNALFLGMLLGIGFLITVSLILSAALASLGKFLTDSLPAPEIILHSIDFVLSAGIITTLFAAMYRFLPNTRVEWRDVWVGAAVTSLLFNVGKMALGVYIRKSAVASSYGAAGSVLVLLLWIYYSGLIFYFGAEFTKVYADRYGSRLKAKPMASPHIRRSSTPTELHA